jgi:hypothetical protein
MNPLRNSSRVAATECRQHLIAVSDPPFPVALPVPDSDDLAAYSRIATERGQTPAPCEDCGGIGHFVAYGHEELCEGCHGSGLDYGECECGHVGILVPDLAWSDDGTADGAVMLCPRCAISCHACNSVSVVADVETREQYCAACWAIQNARLNNYYQGLT